MLIVRVRNSRGQALLINDKEDRYQLLSVTGLEPPETTINTTPIATADGSVFSSLRMGNRNIVIQIRLNGDVENNRLGLYKYFAVKSKITLSFETENRSVKIDGYVQTVECPLFTNNEIMQISIICPNPNFASVNSTTIQVSASSAGSQIENPSDVPMGLNFEINVNDSFYSIALVNELTGESLELDRTGSALGAYPQGSSLFVDTIDLEKSVKFQLAQGYSKVNMMSDVVIGSTFIQIPSTALSQIKYIVDGDPANNYKADVFASYAPFYRSL